MRPPARLLFVLILAVLSSMVFATPVAEAQSEKVLRWDYTVRVDDPASANVRVTMRFTGLDGLVERIGFATAAHGYPVSGISSAGSELRETANGVDLVVRSAVESVSFTVAVNRDAHKTGEFNAHLGKDWGVIKAEAFSLGFNYSYLQGTPFRWDATVRFELPPGWSAEMAYPRAGEGLYALPPGEVLPRGFVALGPVDVEEWQAAGKTYRHARIGKALSYEENVRSYLERSTPYYENVYGPAAGDVLLVVSAPSPMFRGGLGATDSLYVHEETDLRTLAHEHAHVWQLFGTVGEEGASSLWLNEGDAEYHGALSLFVTDFWSLDDVNEFLRGYHDERTREPFRSARLIDATYGGAGEDIAYHKGALVVRHLDQIMQEATNGEVGVSDLLRALNAAHDQTVKESTDESRRARAGPVTNEEILLTANRLVQESAPVDLGPLFDDYVYGTKYPAFESVHARENVAVTNITVSKEAFVAGEPLDVTVRVENRGIVPASKSVPLIVDGVLVDTRNVTVDVGKSTDVVFRLVAPAPGPHHVKSFYLEAVFHVLSPARISIDRLATVPQTLSAGGAGTLLVYVANGGELEGDALLVVLADGARRVGEERVRVGGNVTVAFSFPLKFNTAGAHAVEVHLEGGGSDAVHDLTIQVAEADGDDDGVPDHEDAYPENPRFSRKSLPNDARNLVPASGVAALFAAAAAALVARHRPRA